MPADGTPAPDFSLPSTGGEVRLADLRGRNVLLAFYPAAFTSVCTDEMCALSDAFDRFAAADTVVLPISGDHIPSLRAFKAQAGIDVELVSDIRRNVIRAYGMLDEDRFLARRGYVLIDRDGIVRWSYTEVHPGTRRENDELLAAIEALR